MGIVSGQPETIPEWALIKPYGNNKGYEKSYNTNIGTSRIEKSYETKNDLVVGDAVCLESDGFIYKAGSTNQAIGITEKDYATNSIAKILLFGPSSVYSNLTQGADYYLSNSRISLEPDEETTGNVLQKLGTALSVNLFFVQPGMGVWVG